MHNPDKIVHVTQGNFHVSDDPSVVLSTVLGSCVAACLYDPARGIGGMNHFLLPGNDPNAGQNVKYGAHSMEQLINAMLRQGASRERIEVQLYGGAQVVRNLARIGDSNARFAEQFVREERFRITGRDLGGSNGRRVRFRPSTGRAQVSAFETDLAERTQLHALPSAAARNRGEVELF